LEIESLLNASRFGVKRGPGGPRHTGELALADAGQQTSATIRQTYEHQQAVPDRAAQQFSQAIRGVEAYVKPATGVNAWVNNRGEYLVSGTPGFNAAVALRENWTQLKKAR
jgi:hypothetical protein